MQLPHLQPFSREPLYFLTASTANRRPVLANSTAFETLREIWRRSANIDGWFVGRFVVMPDHVHLFARATQESKPCPQWVKSWKSISSRQIAAVLKIEPPIWQRDYFDRFIRSADSYSEKWDYVRNNPVRKEFVVRPEDWQWQGVIHDLSY